MKLVKLSEAKLRALAHQALSDDMMLAALIMISEKEGHNERIRVNKALGITMDERKLILTTPIAAPNVH